MTMANGRMVEVLAFGLTLTGIVGALASPFYLEVESVESRVAPRTTVHTLTGVVEDGCWTEDEVHGANYWNRSFRPARPVLQVGEPVMLRLKSADVVHSFYSPGLGIGPVEVYPGRVQELLVTPKTAGIFGYYCTTVCGSSHFGMRGVLVVQGEGTPTMVESSLLNNAGQYWLKPPPPPSASLVEQGEWLFHQKGCVTCHGLEGRGGVVNDNYINDFVPPLNTIARKMFFSAPEDVQTIVKLMEKGVPLESRAKSPPVERFGAILTQFRYFRTVIRKGNPGVKKDPKGPAPPLQMPAWEHWLSGDNMDSIIAYLLSQQSWDDVEG